MFGISIIPCFVYLVLIFAFVGAIYRVEKDIILVAYFAFLILLFLVWPFRELRYLYSIYALLLYFFIQGLVYAVESFPGFKLFYYMGILILGLCLVRNMANTAFSTKNADKVLSSHGSVGPEMPESKDMFAYINRYTKKTDVITFFKPRVMHLYTGRISLALFNDIEEVQQKADYYVENRKMGNYFQIPIENTMISNINGLEMVFSNNAFNIYKISK